MGNTITNPTFRFTELPAINEFGCIKIPQEFLAHTEMKDGDKVWVIRDGYAIVLTKEITGYEDCAMQEETIKENGQITLPLEYLDALHITTKEIACFNFSFPLLASNVAIVIEHSLFESEYRREWVMWRRRANALDLNVEELFQQIEQDKPIARKATVDEMGKLRIPLEFCQEAGLVPEEPVWIIRDDMGIVITKKADGFIQFRGKRSSMDEQGNIQIPACYLKQLKTDKDGRIDIRLSCYGLLEIDCTDQEQDLPDTFKVSVDCVGALTISKALRDQAKLERNTNVWVIDDNGAAIVIRNDYIGYEDCERTQCLLDADGKLELPPGLLYRLEIDQHQEVTASVAQEEKEISIETFTWTNYFFEN